MSGSEYVPLCSPASSDSSFGPYTTASEYPTMSRIFSLVNKKKKIIALVVLVCSLLALFSVGSYKIGHSQSCVTNSTSLLHDNKVTTFGISHYDGIDTFQNFKYRNSCLISSLDLHKPTLPLCEKRKELLTAMSSGGRIGFDAPYQPRYCEMRWFNTKEICEIVGRFEKIIFIGDSMMRHVIGSINVLLREDLGYGAVTDWNFTPKERRQCFCNNQFNVKECSLQGIFRTADVDKNDPASISCPARKTEVMIEQMVRYPIPVEELVRLRDQLPATKPKKPYGFIFGHGLWNDLEIQSTLDWIEQIVNLAEAKAPWLVDPLGKSLPEINAVVWPRLFVVPNAAGKDKPTKWVASQGAEALMKFEEDLTVPLERTGIDKLGTWNMSIQATKYDGVHLDLKGNLVKAMMVLNWLNAVDTKSF